MVTLKAQEQALEQLRSDSPAGKQDLGKAPTDGSVLDDGDSDAQELIAADYYHQNPRYRDEKTGEIDFCAEWEDREWQRDEYNGASYLPEDLEMTEEEREYFERQKRRLQRVSRSPYCTVSWEEQPQNWDSDDPWSIGFRKKDSHTENTNEDGSKAVDKDLTWS